jgi:hypothetical protein
VIPIRWRAAFWAVAAITKLPRLTETYESSESSTW